MWNGGSQLLSSNLWQLAAEWKFILVRAGYGLGGACTRLIWHMFRLARNKLKRREEPHRRGRVRLVHGLPPLQSRQPPRKRQR